MPSSLFQVTLFGYHKPLVYGVSPVRVRVYVCVSTPQSSYVTEFDSSLTRTHSLLLHFLTFFNILLDIQTQVQNLDDGTAPPQGSMVWVEELLSVKAPTPTVHLYNKGGHGFGLCETVDSWLEVCDWPKAVQRFLQVTCASDILCSPSLCTA